MKAAAFPGAGARAQSRPALMRAAVLAAPGVFEIREAPLPLPVRGQALVGPEGCGVCASNPPPSEGRPWFAYPMAPGALGREGRGMVGAIGDGYLAAEDSLIPPPSFLQGAPCAS